MVADLDLSSICQQMISDEVSCPYVEIITQKGIYRYAHLPFGVSEGNDENTMTDSTTTKIQLKSQIIQL